MYLVLPGVLIIFIMFDLVVFLMNKKTSESKTYFPDFKIWGMGFIMGLTFFLFSYFEPLKEFLTGSRVTPPELIQQAGVMTFFLVVIGLILAALVKIVKDE